VFRAQAVGAILVQESQIRGWWLRLLGMQSRMQTGLPPSNLSTTNQRLRKRFA
jgi:hypothetical protein